MFDWPDFFSTGSEHFNEVFLFFESYHFLKIMKRKCQKTEFRGGHLGFLAATLDWQWVLFNPCTLLTLTIICTNFGAFIIKWTIDSPMDWLKWIFWCGIITKNEIFYKFCIFQWWNWFVQVNSHLSLVGCTQKLDDNT